MRRRLLSLAMALAMALSLLPMAAWAEEEPSTTDTVAPPAANNSLDERDTSGYGDEALPAAPDISGEVITVTPENAQYTLDGAYGSINGKTIIFTAGNYGALELGRATKYSGSDTEYYIGGISAEKQCTFEDYVAQKTSGQWTASAYYVRNMRDVTLQAAEGAEVTITSLSAIGGHINGQTYDYVLEIAREEGSAYFLAQHWDNITFDGLHFTGQVNIASSQAETAINGVQFKNCSFTTGGTASTNGAGLRFYSEGNNGGMQNLTVESCTFTDCYQGIYTMHIRGVEVTGSYFTNTGHNAIAIQTQSAVENNTVVITKNTFSNIKDRVIRFGDVGSGSRIDIWRNTATGSGDSVSQVIKAESLAEDIQYNIHDNNWGEGTSSANEELADRGPVAQVNGEDYYLLRDAIDNAQAGGTITLLSDFEVPSGEYIEYNLPEGSTFDLGGKTLTVPFTAAVFQGKNATIQNGTIASTGNYALWIGNGTEETSITVRDIVVNSGINVYAADVTLESVTATGKEFYAVWADDSADITILSGTYSSQSGTALSLFAGKDDDGTEDGVDDHGSITVCGGNINGKIAQAYEDPENPIQCITITGGTFTDQSVTDYLAEGYIAEQVDGKYVVKEASYDSIEVATATAPADEPETVTSDTIDENDESNASAAAGSVEETVAEGGASALQTAAKDVDQTSKKNAAVAELDKAGIIEVTADGTLDENTSVTIVTQPYFRVEATEYSVTNDATPNVITFDVTPMYRTIATTNPNDIKLDGADKNAVELGTPQELEITQTITMTLDLLAGFFGTAEVTPDTKAYVTHIKDDGQVYVYEADVAQKEAPDSGYTITFINPHGFSILSVSNEMPVAEYGGETYTTLQAAVSEAAKTGGTVTLLQNTTENITIPAGSQITIQGQSGSEVLYGSISCTVETTDGAEEKTTNLTLRSLTLNGLLPDGTQREYGISSQNQTSTTVSGLNLVMENCKVQNFSKKGIYLTNAVGLDINGCTFTDNATEQMNDPNTYGDYTIDLNLMNVDAGALTIRNTTFSGGCGEKAVIKVSSRGGDSDAGVSGVPSGTTTSVDSLTISGCTFSDTPAAAADVNIGTDSKVDKNNSDNQFEDNTTGNFLVTISGNYTPVVVNPAYKTYYNDADDKYYAASGDGKGTVANITVPAGATANKTATGDISVVVPDDDNDRPSYSGGSSTPSYSNTIEVGDGGDVKVSPRTPEAGDTVTITPDPDAGYEVDEVIVTDRNGDAVRVTANRNGTYTFEQPRGRVTIEVTFVRTDSGLPFIDVAANAWYYDAVAYAYENGLMSGTASNLFSPNATTTRGMIVTMLYRLEGEPRVTTGSAFDDVDASMYYADAIAWANANGIVTGYDDTTFGPNDAITREQMAAILYRYAQYKGYRTTASADLSGYVDAGDVSAYALPALQWANAEGLVTGTSSNTLTPDGSAVRAQVATIFMRFMEGVAE